MRLKDKAGPCSKSFLLSTLVFAVKTAKTTNAASLWKTSSKPILDSLVARDSSVTMTDNLDSNGMVKRSGITPVPIDGLYDAPPATFTHDTYGANQQGHESWQKYAPAGMTHEQWMDEDYLQNVASEPQWTYSQSEDLEEAAQEIAEEQAKKAASKGKSSRRARRMLQMNDVPPIQPFADGYPPPPGPFNNGIGPEVTSPMIPGQSYDNVPPAPIIGIPAADRMPTDPKMGFSDRVTNAAFSMSNGERAGIIAGSSVALCALTGAAYCVCCKGKKKKKSSNADQDGGQVVANVREQGERLPQRSIPMSEYPQHQAPEYPQRPQRSQGHPSRQGGYMQKRSIEPSSGYDYLAPSSGVVPGIEYSAFAPSTYEGSSKNTEAWQDRHPVFQGTPSHLHEQYMNEYQAEQEYANVKPVRSRHTNRKMLDGNAQGPSEHPRTEKVDPVVGLEVENDTESGVGHASKKEKIALGVTLGTLTGVGGTILGFECKKRRDAKKAAKRAALAQANTQEDTEQSLQKRSHLSNFNPDHMYNAPAVNLPEVYGQDMYQPPPMPYEEYIPEYYDDYEAYEGPTEEQYADQLAYQMANQDINEEESTTTRRRRSKKGTSSNRRALHHKGEGSQDGAAAPNSGTYGTPEQYAPPDVGQFTPPGAYGDQGEVNPIETPPQYGSNFHGGQLPDHSDGAKGYIGTGIAVGGITALTGLTYGVNRYCTRDQRRAEKAAKAAAAIAEAEGAGDVEAPPPPPPAQARPAAPAQKQAPPSRERMPPSQGEQGGRGIQGGRGAPNGRGAAGGRGASDLRPPPGHQVAGGRGRAGGASGMPPNMGAPAGAMGSRPAAPQRMRQGAPSAGGAMPRPPQHMTSAPAPGPPRPAMNDDFDDDENFSGESEFDEEILNHPPPRPYHKRSLPSVLEVKKEEVIKTPSESRAYSSGRRDLFAEGSGTFGKRALTWNKE